MRFSGGRTWWAHFELTRINIEPTILPKKIEDARERATLVLAAALIENKSDLGLGSSYVACTDGLR